MLVDLANDDMPDIFWDGVTPFYQMIVGQPQEERIGLGENVGASFLAINPIKYLLPFLDPANRDYQDFFTNRPSLEKVIINLPNERLY